MKVFGYIGHVCLSAIGHFVSVILRSNFLVV